MGIPFLPAQRPSTPGKHFDHCVTAPGYDGTFLCRKEAEEYEHIFYRLEVLDCHYLPYACTAAAGGGLPLRCRIRRHLALQPNTDLPYLPFAACLRLPAFVIRFRMPGISALPPRWRCFHATPYLPATLHYHHTAAILACPAVLKTLRRFRLRGTFRAGCTATTTGFLVVAGRCDFLRRHPDFTYCLLLCRGYVLCSFTTCSSFLSQFCGGLFVPLPSVLHAPTTLEATYLLV
jgi:hypothetical protein